MPNPWIIIGAAGFCLLLIVGSFFYGRHVEGLEWGLAIAEQKNKASDELAKQTRKVLEAERLASELTTKLEKENAEHQASLQRAYDAARRAATAAGGLRDPGRGNGRGSPAAGPATAPGIPAQGAPTGRVLSAEAEQFLFEFAREADQLNLDYRACRQQALRSTAE